MAYLAPSVLLALAAVACGGSPKTGNGTVVRAGIGGLEGGSRLTATDVGSPGLAPIASRNGELPRLGSHPTCSDSTHPNWPIQTAPIATISMKDGQLSVEPDSVVQPVAVGFVGWQLGSPRITVAQVNYEDGPLDSDTFVIPPNRVVGSPVRQDAACKGYKYSVTVILQDGSTQTVDPWSPIIPH